VGEPGNQIRRRPVRRRNLLCGDLPRHGTSSIMLFEIVDA